MVTDLLPLIELDTVDSTNSWLLFRVRREQIDLPVAVFAREQTAGRGRSGRSWIAQPNDSLCFSLGFKLCDMPAPWLGLVVGISVIEWLVEQGVSQVGLKWPNDLMVGASKLGGVLCESAFIEGGYVLVVGLGLNVRPVQSGNPSLSLHELGLELAPGDLNKVAQTLSQHILLALEAAMKSGFSGVADQFRSHDIYLGQQVRVIDQGRELYRGRAAGIGEEGHYLIETQSGIVGIQSGDLSLRQVDDE